MLTIEDIIEKRRARWHERHDIEYDKLLVTASVTLIFKTPRLRDAIVERPYLLIPIAFYIVDKKRNTVPFFFNEVQSDFIEQLEKRGTNKPFYILKCRQQGFTSLITAIQLSYAIVRKNFSGFTIADRSDNTQAIFNDKARVVFSRLPDVLKPHEKFNSKNEMFFDVLNSSWRIATATEDVGRSRTLNMVHFSEVAFYTCNLSGLQAGIGEALTAGALIIYETTANGFNQAKDLWDSGSCHNLFYEWWKTAEYRSTEYEYLEDLDEWLTERVRLLMALGLDREQITWYCKKYAGYTEKTLIRQEYPCSADEAFVSSGESMFDKDALANQLTRIRSLPPPTKGYFTYKKRANTIPDSDGDIADISWEIYDVEFTKSSDGYISIRDFPQRIKDKVTGAEMLVPYVIGGDTAGRGEDFFTAKCIDNMTGKTVATLRKQRIDEDLYAEQVLCLAMFYHTALIGIETNYSRGPMRTIATKYGYTNVYYRERIDHIDKKTEKVLGFETNKKTKPIIIGELVSLMRDNPTVETDEETLKEMTTFAKMENGSMGAISGCHDDLVMALAIAHFISSQQSSTPTVAETDDKDFISENFNTDNYSGETPFMDWEDY